LEGGPPCFRQDFSCPVLLKIYTHPGHSISDTRISLSLSALPSHVLLYCRFISRRGMIHSLRYTLSTALMQRCIAYTPELWALPASLAATRGISSISLPSGTSMVQFPEFRSNILLYSYARDRYLSSRVTPFGYLRFFGCVLLPAAFRSLSRPSSPRSS
jgi:hypothetical protein